MTNSHTMHVDGVGVVLFEESIRARRVIIYVRPDKTVRVAVPKRSSFKKALEFVYLKNQWIQRQLTKAKKDEHRTKALWEAFQSIDKVKAKKELKYRLSHVAKEHGFKFNKIYIRNQRTRWGSCSCKKNISLNLKLVLLPKELIDYVIFHELVHTRILNHSKKFWAELDRYVEDSKVMARRLKINDLRLL